MADVLTGEGEQVCGGMHQGASKMSNHVLGIGFAPGAEAAQHCEAVEEVEEEVAVVVAKDGSAESRAKRCQQNPVTRDVGIEQEAVVHAARLFLSLPLSVKPAVVEPEVCFSGPPDGQMHQMNDRSRRPGHSFDYDSPFPVIHLLCSGTGVRRLPHQNQAIAATNLISDGPIAFDRCLRIASDTSAWRLQRYGHRYCADHSENEPDFEAVGPVMGGDLVIARLVYASYTRTAHLMCHPGRTKL
jgi:hypothetical protein